MSFRISVLVAATALMLVTIVSFAQQNPAEEARLKQLDAGPATIDVSKYPPEQQQAYKLFQTKCSHCHPIARGINTEMVLPGDWERYIKRMMHKPDSGISDPEARTVFRFLVYDASVRKADQLHKALASLPPAERTAAVARIKEINPAFTE